jgi:hypothetical protein
MCRLHQRTNERTNEESSLQPAVVARRSRLAVGCICFLIYSADLRHQPAPRTPATSSVRDDNVPVYPTSRRRRLTTTGDRYSINAVNSTVIHRANKGEPARPWPRPRPDPTRPGSRIGPSTTGCHGNNARAAASLQESKSGRRPGAVNY